MCNVICSTTARSTPRGVQLIEECEAGSAQTVLPCPSLLPFQCTHYEILQDYVRFISTFVVLANLIVRTHTCLLHTGSQEALCTVTA